MEVSNNPQDELSLRQLRALNCLNLLQMQAVRRQTINYETLAAIMGLTSKGNALAQAVSPVLYDVYNFCTVAGLPHLTVLVVRKSGRDKDLPGPGFWKVHSGDIPDFNDRVRITEELTAECFRVFERIATA